jgi:hypothetical protein
MDEIYHNVTPLFTEWVIGRAYLHEPFIVIDVGVQGGPMSAGSTWAAVLAPMASALSAR